MIVAKELNIRSQARQRKPRVNSEINLELINQIQNYFRGERDLSLLMIPFAFAMLALAYYSWVHYKDSMGTALSITCVVMSLGLLCGGTIMMIKGERDMARKVSTYQQSPQQFVTEETQRMGKVNQMWSKLKFLWAVLIATSLCLLLFMNIEWVKGLSLALILGASMFMVIDMLAEHRAVIYEQHLLGQRG